MAKDPHIVGMGRRFESEDMFLSTDRKSLYRGKRTTPRTEVCRPCLVWLENAPDNKYPGVVLDMNPYGMLIRTIISLSKGQEIVVQLMRDDQYSQPLAQPRNCKVVRKVGGHGEFTDHGVKIIQKNIKRPESKPYVPERVQRSRRSVRSRMHTIDYTAGGRSKRRGGR